MSAEAGRPPRPPVADRFKAFLARHVFHPLQGMALGEWWALLRRHRFAVDLRHSTRALVQTVLSAANSVNAPIERVRFGKRIEAAGYRVRHDKVDAGGSVTLRHKGKLHHIGIGCPYAGWRVILLVDGLDIRILGLDGSPLRHLTLDPSVDYQRIP